MGFPLIGETIQFIIPSRSIDIPPFIDKRMKRYGPLFKTSLVGRPVVVSCDPEFNQFIFQQEGKLVELWYLDSFAKILRQDTLTFTPNGYIHKYLRNRVLNQFGADILKRKLLSEMEHVICAKLQAWSTLPTVELKSATSAMIFDYTSKQLFSYEADKSEENLAETFNNFMKGLMSIPLNLPGTAFHECLKRLIKLLSRLLEERRASSSGNCKGDFLDQIVEDMKNETFLTDDFAVSMMFGILLASIETLSGNLTVLIKLLTGHPAVVKELMEEHEAILKNRGNANSGLSWSECQSMTFTHHVVSEALRMGNIPPGILRRATNDIQVNGYTIPKGWIIMVVPAALQLNPTTYEDPLAFNPWRWKDMGSNVTGKNFITFGGGTRSCVGADFAKVLMAVFLHFFLTKYRWTKAKGGEVVRTPALGFGNGFHIQVSEKHE
ncbi:hypothetical protein L1049_026372 [Liquidambar formosana]|uniref:Cytochrome P450 n=1 Tax=Liquidambar formosana TaxID=63359 RepID=A0AAP0NER5_LIQFO